MNEKRYKKKIEIQNKLIARQSKKIADLMSQNEALKLECEEKDKIIISVESLRNELTENVERHKELVCEYESLVKELKTMKEFIDETVYKNKWRIIKFLIR